MSRSVLLALISLSLGCGPDALDTAGPPTPPDLTEALGADQARAGQLAETDIGAFVGGTAGEAQAGDFLLYNDRARFVVRGLRQGHWYVGEPGSLIDLDVVRPEGEADRDGLNELLTMAGFGRLFVAERIEVLRDGQDGGAAVVRATGHDAAIPYIEGVLELPGLFEPNGVAITQTFSLEPGSPALEITTTVDNVTNDDLVLDMLDAGMTDVATFGTFTPGAGFDGEAPDGDRPMLAMVARTNDQAWAIYQADADMPEGLAGMGDSFDMLLAQGDRLALEEGASASYTRLIGVARDLATLEEHRRGLRGLPTGVVTGVVTEAGSDAPVTGARVFLTDPDGQPLTMAISAADGTYRLVGEPGAAAVVVSGDATNEWMELPGGPGAYGPYAHGSTNERALAPFADPAAPVAPLADGYGRGEAATVSLDDGETTTLDLALPQRAWLDLTLVDEDGVPLPGVAFLGFAEGVEDPWPADGRLWEHRPRGDARRAIWVLDGQVTTPAPAGSYALIAHHGFTHELGRAEGVDLVAGETTAVTLVLPRAVDTEGWTSMDPHSHGSPSIDGECTIEERLITAAANGLDVHLSTDHDHVTDYRPVAEAIGLGGVLVTVPGDEISPTVRGHHNIYPLEPDPTLPNGGAPRWWEQAVSTAELHAMWRERVGDDGVLQVNHGRDTSGMFGAASYDPVTGEPGEPDYFGTAFDVMEVLNSKGFGDAEDLMLDWCSLLDQGLRPVAVAVSDSHTRLSGPGFPRTWVQVEGGVADQDDVPALIAALKAGRAQVSAGPLVTLEVSDGGVAAGPGDTIQAASVEVGITVEAPSWIPVETVRLYGAGCTLLEQWTVDTLAAEPPLWFTASTTVTVDQPGYLFVQVEGSQDLWPAWPGAHPYALTNAVFVEPR